MTQNTMEEKLEKLRCPQCSIWFCQCVELKNFLLSEKQISYQEGFKKAMGEIEKYRDQHDDGLWYGIEIIDHLLSIISQKSEEESKENK